MVEGRSMRLTISISNPEDRCLPNAILSPSWKRDPKMEGRRDHVIETRFNAAI